MHPLLGPRLRMARHPPKLSMYLQLPARICIQRWRKFNGLDWKTQRAESDHQSAGFLSVIRRRQEKRAHKGRLPLYKNSGCTDVCPRIVQEFCKEVVIWKYLSHPNILPFVGATLVIEPKREKFEIVSEFMENGDIRTFMENNADVNRLELVSFYSRLVDPTEQPLRPYS